MLQISSKLITVRIYNDSSPEPDEAFLPVTIPQLTMRRLKTIEWMNTAPQPGFLGSFLAPKLHPIRIMEPIMKATVYHSQRWNLTSLISPLLRAQNPTVITQVTSSTPLAPHALCAQCIGCHPIDSLAKSLQPLSKRSRLAKRAAQTGETGGGAVGGSGCTPFFLLNLAPFPVWVQRGGK